MNTASANEAKASFDHIYTQATPHDYLQHLGRLDYSICDEFRPFCDAAARYLQARDGRVRMLDIGCSYGINAAVAKFGTPFTELARCFDANVPRASEHAEGVARRLFARLEPEVELECGGLDVSTPAIRFARRVGLLDHGIDQDLEADDAELAPADRSWLEGVNLLASTGAIGYVTDRTFRRVLDAMGAGGGQAVCLSTVLRMFDPEPVARALRAHGLQSALIGDTLLPQRRFHDRQEQADVVSLLRERKLDTGPEEGGRLYARLLVAARAEELPHVVRRLEQVSAHRPTLYRPPGAAAPSRAAGRSPSAEATQS